MSDDFRGRGGSPWGSPPGGGNGSGRGRPRPPNIDEVIEKENIVDAAFSYARTLKDSAPLALRATKKIIKACSAKPPQEVRKLQYNIFPDLWFSDDHKEAEKAFMEKRKPIFTGR